MNTDYLLLDNNKNGWNILTKTRSICRPITEVNVRGYQCNEGTAPFWTLSNHFHLDSSYTSSQCSCTNWTHDAVRSEDNFGQYRYPNSDFSCSATNISTTNFWMGSSVSVPTISPS